ncbi:MAG TPA: DUF6134 family protein [Gemmataceae bacterium]|nr:DUF6134 family protein [Gemmataceae bacterium]
MAATACAARRWAWCLLVGAALVLPGLSRAGAADVEVRDFSIAVDGKAAGDYHMTVRRQDDGSVSMTAQSDVHVKVVLVTVYSYGYRGVEVWKDSRLQHLACSGKENSKVFAVTADPATDGLHVKANGQEHVTRPDVWTTSCWQLPDAKFRNQDVPLLGCDNGRDIAGHLQFVGNEAIRVAGQDQVCAHWRLINGVPHELWYDGQERLVRHEWLTDGHRTVLEMVGLRH